MSEVSQTKTWLNRIQQGLSQDEVLIVKESFDIVGLRGCFHIPV
jgi:hypothetical protein